VSLAALPVLPVVFGWLVSVPEVDPVVLLCGEAVIEPPLAPV
jgi:hypothetical protein